MWPKQNKISTESQISVIYYQFGKLRKNAHVQIGLSAYFFGAAAANAI